MFNYKYIRNRKKSIISFTRLNGSCVVRFLRLQIIFCFIFLSSFVCILPGQDSLVLIFNEMNKIETEKQ